MASTILPFSNEVLSVLTSSGLPIFAGLYEASPSTLRQTITKSLIDTTALSGIILAATATAAAHGSTSGAVQGIAIILVAFTLPGLTFHPLTHKFCHSCSPSKKILFGLVLISILFLVERYVVHPIAHSYSESHDVSETEEEH